MALPDATLAGLRSANDAALGIDREFLRDAMASFGLASSAQISRAEIQGTFHRLYDLRETGLEPRLLRVAAIPGIASAHLMALECAVMSSLRERGLSIPSCAYREVPRAGVARGVHLVERAQGASLTTIDDDEARMLVALGWVARFLEELHGVRGAGFGPLSLAACRRPEAAVECEFVGVHRHWDDYLLLRLDEHLQSCRAAGAVTGDEEAQIARLFASARQTLTAQPSALLHGDPGSHNFMIDASGLRAVIDWEDALLGDPLFDLASLCTFHPERRHAVICSAYGAVLETGSAAWTRFWLYFLRIALAKTVHRQRFGYTDRPDRQPASQRIQLALKKLEGDR